MEIDSDRQRRKAEGLFLTLNESVHSPSYHRKSKGSQSNNANLQPIQIMRINSFINNTTYHTPSRKYNLLFVNLPSMDTKASPIDALNDPL